MPTAIDLPVKYKFRKGLDALTPPDETPDAFDPGALASADANEDPDPTPIPAPTTSAADSGPKVALNPLSAGAPPRKFPEAKMPPPEPMEAPPQPTPDPGPQSAAATPAPPPTPKIIEPQQIGDLDRAAATSQDPNAINSGQILPQEEKSAADKLSKLHADRPEAPQSNWAQRLGTAILSMTKFAPAINQIMHPKWSEQNAAYQGQLKDLEAQQKEEETQASTDASVAQKEASAAQKNAQAASYAATQDTRRNSAKDRLDAAFIKAMGPDAMQLNPSEKVPDGFAVFTNPSNPNDKWIRRSAIVNLPKELMGEFPGLAEGAPITRKEFEDGLKSARAKDLENVKAGNKTAKPQYTGAERMAIQAEGGDPDAQNLDPALLKRALDRVKPKTSNNIFMPPGLGGAQPQSTLVGDEYLKTLPAGTSAQIKAIAEGRAAMPPLGMRGQGAAIRDAVFRYDPDYSDQRAQVRKAFTTGPDGKNIGALNTAPVHLDQLGDAADALKNGSFVPGNRAYNYFATMFGGAPPTNFDALKAAVAGELASALKGNATDTEIATMGHNINNAHSPEEIKGAIETNLHILGAKLKTYNERYHQQIPNDTVWSPVMPSAKAVFEKHGFDPMASAHGNNGDDRISVQIPGHPPGKIPRAGLEQFKKDHPGAEVL